jgi:hypothetical protein
MMKSLRHVAHVTLLLVATAILAACGTAERDDSGQIVNSGNLDVLLMQVGDCFQDLHEDTWFLDDVPGVPCTDPHDNEVFYIFPIEGQVWPGDDLVDQMAIETCMAAFEPYVGITYEESRLDYNWFTPTQRAWEQLGFSEVICFGYAYEERLTGSIKGSRQ